MHPLTVRSERPAEGNCMSRRALAVRVVSIACVAMFVSAGCGSSHEAKLVGTWKDTTPDAHGSTFTFNEDGSMTGALMTGSWGILQPTTVAVSGTWKLTGENLVFTIGQSTYGNENLAGLSMSEKVLSVEDHSFRTVDRTGKETHYSRVN